MMKTYIIRMRQGKLGGGKGALVSNDLSLTLGCNNDQTLIIIGKMKTYALAGNIIGRKPQNGGNGGGYREEVAYTMDTIGNFGIAQVEGDMEQKIFTLDADRSNSMKSANPNSGIHESNVAKTLDTTTPTPQKAQGGQMIVAYDARGNGDGKTANTITGDHANRVTDFTPIVAAVGVDGYNQSTTEGVSKTISSAASDYHHVPCVCQHGEVAGTLTERHDSSPCADRGQNVVAQYGISLDGRRELQPQEELSHTECVGTNPGYKIGTANHLSVRRLMPIETERLMGFPDNWTKIPWRGKPADECPDAPRYKACGNSMGVNCMRWIGLGIEAVEAKHRK